ncbi:MAG: molecular chaperone DnaK [Candidatus Stahlbacteria bacterium]|nr:molecular chaperone DnaK [Candidatus Stahlbacteria bacterium]
MSDKAIGIDLGTTNSCVAIVEGAEKIVISNPDGGRTTPSVVTVTAGGERLVGPLAKRQSILNPDSSIYSIKRFMGRRYSEVGEEMKLVPYKVVEGPHQDARVMMGGKEYSPPEVSALILQYLKKSAEDYLGQKVSKAVITVPAYFNDSQRKATKDAGTIAGLEVLRIINEPTAASLAYGVGTKKRERVAVYDFGGGTFDISIIEIDMSESPPVIEVLATNGDTHLGGDNIDQRIVEWIVSSFRKEQGIDLSKDRSAIQRVRDAGEKAKCELSTSMETSISLPFITADANGPKHLDLKLTRAKLEQLIEDLIERSHHPCEQAVEDAIKRAGSSIKRIEDIDVVILVGGMTRMPRIQKLVADFFGKEPSKGVNPDEVVAMGAAIQADSLSGEGKKELLLLDVTPLTLGIETLGSVMTPMIPRNTTIPTRKSQIYTTAADSQTAVTIHVLQGERPMAPDNRSLGKFDLMGIPSAPRGVPQIEVTFDIDANGILNVKAIDKATNKEQSIRITGSSGLSDSEVGKMVDEGKVNEAEDKKRREMIEVRNQADTLIYSVEKSLKEFGDKVSETERKDIENAVERLKKTLSGDDMEAMKKEMDELQKASYKLAEEMYKQSAAQQGGETKDGAEPKGNAETKDSTADAGEKKKAEGPIEADYEVIDEDKK